MTSYPESGLLATMSGAIDTRRGSPQRRAAAVPRPRSGRLGHAWGGRWRCPVWGEGHGGLLLAWISNRIDHAEDLSARRLFRRAMALRPTTAPDAGEK